MYTSMNHKDKSTAELTDLTRAYKIKTDKRDGGGVRVVTVQTTGACTVDLCERHNDQSDTDELAVRELCGSYPLVSVSHGLHHGECDACAGERRGAEVES